MAVSEEVKAAVINACGRGENRSEVARRHGLSKNIVLGIWHRRPRDTPEEAAGLAAAQAAAAAPWTPETARFSRQAGAAWAALLAAGPAGADAEAILRRMYPHGMRPASTKSVVSVALLRLRDAAKPHGYEVVAIVGSAPTRWAIVRPGETAAPVPPSAAPPPAAPKRGPAAVAPAVQTPPLPAPPPPRPAPAAEPEPIDLPEPSRLLPSLAPREPIGAAVFTGAAREVERLKPGCCRWPIGDVGDPEFRFCGGPAAQAGMPYCREHRRIASDGIIGRRAA